MDYFSEIPDAHAIIYANGVYRQVKLAARAGRLYARYGAGYVRLMQGGGSSHPKVRWNEIDTPDGAYREKTGYVYYTPQLQAAE